MNIFAGAQKALLMQPNAAALVNAAWGMALFSSISNMKCTFYMVADDQQCFYD